MSDVGFDFGGVTEKRKLDFPFFNPEDHLEEKYLAKLRRRKKMLAYQIRNNEPIKICANCAKSNLDVSQSTRVAHLSVLVNQCKCGGPVVQFETEKESIDWFGRPRFSGYCTRCEEAKPAKELEYAKDELVPHVEKELEIEVVDRRIRPNKVDMHHLQYERSAGSDLESHSREVVVPLCKDCHQAQQNGDLPAFDPDKISPQENILSPVFTTDLLNPENIEIETSPVGRSKDL